MLRDSFRTFSIMFILWKREAIYNLPFRTNFHKIWINYCNNNGMHSVQLLSFWCCVINEAFLAFSTFVRLHFLRSIFHAKHELTFKLYFRVYIFFSFQNHFCFVQFFCVSCCFAKISYFIDSIFRNSKLFPYICV